MRMTMTRAALTVGASLAVVLLSASTASAIYLSTTLHDWGSGSTSYNQRAVSACDTKQDSRGIRTEYTTVNHPSRTGADHVGDANGFGGDCGTESSWDDSRITAVRVCARNSDTGVTIECTPWVSE
jgi:hypothetical protein